MKRHFVVAFALTFLSATALTVLPDPNFAWALLPGSNPVMAADIAQVETPRFEVQTAPMTVPAPSTPALDQPTLSPPLSAEALRAKSRYYVGVGMEVEQISKDEPTDSEFHWAAGYIIVFPMKNGPAMRAGVASYNVLMAVDGKDVSQMKLEDAVEAMKGGSEGSSVRLKFRRHGGAKEVYEVDVVREKIDKVAALYLGRELATSVINGQKNDGTYGLGGYGVKAYSNVTEKTPGVFYYWYQLKNVGPTPVRLQWEILDRAMSGHYNFMNVIDLAPGEIREFAIDSEEIPTRASKMMRLMTPVSAEYAKDVQKARGFVGAEGIWTSGGFDVSGYIPEVWLKGSK